MMGEVVNFKRKRLSGFLPEETVEEYRDSLRALLTPVSAPADTAPSEMPYAAPPEDCA